MSFPALSRSHYYLTVVALLEPKEYRLEQVSVILQGKLPRILRNGNDPLDANAEFCRIVSTFLVDRERAGVFWVNSKKYADLARYILEFLRDK